MCEGGTLTGSLYLLFTGAWHSPLLVMICLPIWQDPAAGNGSGTGEAIPSCSQSTTACTGNSQAGEKAGGVKDSQPEGFLRGGHQVGPGGQGKVSVSNYARPHPLSLISLPGEGSWTRSSKRSWLNWRPLVSLTSTVLRSAGGSLLLLPPLPWHSSTRVHLTHPIPPTTHASMQTHVQVILSFMQRESDVV